MGTKYSHCSTWNTTPNALATASYAFGGDVVAVGKSSYDANSFRYS